MKTFVAAVALAALPALPAIAAAETACVVEANTPELAPDAQTVALLTCDALRARGADVGQPTDAVTTGPAWRVGLHRLGDGYLVRVARQGVAGQPDRTEQLQLQRLGEIEKAAPRLAEALTGGRPLAQSQEMESVTRAEAKTMEKKDGDFLWGIGLFGMGAIGTDSIGSFGFELALDYETPSFGVHGAFRGGGAGGAGDDSVTVSEIAVGGRYFFSQTDTSLFVGAGLSGLSVEVDTTDAYLDGEGLGLYGEFGVEMFRLYGSRLSAVARVSVPFFTADGSEWSEGYTDEEDVSRYVVPVTVGIGYVW